MIYLASDQTFSTFILYIMIVRLMRPFTIQEDTFSYLSRIRTAMKAVSVIWKR